MNPSFDVSTDDDPRILEISREYLAELESGVVPQREVYLARYPELAEAVSECLDGIDLAHQLSPKPPVAQPEYLAAPLGDFQILKEVGRGGMGVVYEAIQLSLGRRVALKVLPFAAALDAKHLQRFKTEAHAAAQLHHTNIVPVYAVGCERGVHFYAMQLIDGRSLAAVIQEMRETALIDGSARMRAGKSTAQGAGLATSVPGESARLSLRTVRGSERFRVAARHIEKVAQALEYAHEAGVVHRDIKPANLLLDSKGCIWVADFGLAQVSADPGLTQTGDVVGTLRYMSPEQASGQRVPVDHRADVYSLGATLYELLALQPIFDGQDRATLLQQILNDEPEALRKSDRSIPVELETIVLKAVSKLPAERYSTAGEMAADLQRYLDERPILARRPTLWDRTRKWMRRHPSYVGAAVLLLVCGVLGLSITTALVTREQAATKAAYQRELSRATEAEARFQLARRAADKLIQLAEEDLSDSPFQEGLKKQLLEASLEYYQEFVALRVANSEAQKELAATRDRVQKILADLALLASDRQLFLLREPAVLADLGISDEQLQKLVELGEQLGKRHRNASENPQPMTATERWKRSLDDARRNEAALADILTTPQLQRLPQIARQCQGPMAFREPEIAKLLKITSVQKERIRDIEQETMWNRFDRGRSGNQSNQTNRDERVKLALERIEAILTPDQRAHWKALTGEPYTGPRFFPGRGGPGGGPGGPGGHGGGPPGDRGPGNDRGPGGDQGPRGDRGDRNGPSPRGERGESGREPPPRE